VLPYLDIVNVVVDIVMKYGTVESSAALVVGVSNDIDYFYAETK